MDLLTSMGNALLNWSGNILKMGYFGWSGCVDMAYQFLSQNPHSSSYGGGWSAVTASGGVYGVMEILAASLLILFFIMGWFKETIDIRNSLSLDNIFKIFIRFALAAGLMTSSVSLAAGITDISVAVVGRVAKVETRYEEPDDLFDSIKTAIEDDEDDGGGTLIVCGLLCLLASLIGAVVILVSGVSVILAVFSRAYKLLLCVPFAPVAFSGFAGGGEFSQSGIAWIRSFIGYAFEAAVIAIALNLALNMFGDLSIMGKLSNDHSTKYYVSYAILSVVGYCIPMVACSACVKGAETIVRKCLGLG